MMIIFPVFVILNVLSIFMLYGLLCNTAVITKRDQDNGMYIYDRKYIIGDIIRIDDRDRFPTYVITMLMCCVPFTWWMCLFAGGIVAIGYHNGIFDVYGKNKIIY